MARGQFINGKWRSGAGVELSRQSPADGALTWQGASAAAADVQEAVAAATQAAGGWAQVSVDRRSEYLEAFTLRLAEHGRELRDAICAETGKPRWEAQTEVDAVHSKIGLTQEALSRRRSDSSVTKDGVSAAIRYRPLGTVAVLGPFNLPAHLPNGHIVPALLAGNTVVFKPSELTPAVGEIYTRCWEEAGIPPGVFNMIHGGREQGAALAAHEDVAGVLFTGSRAAGVSLSKMLADRPEKLLALEMGGNNPLLATRVADLDAAAYAIVQSAFITAGQRCTCARRLILLQGAEGDRVLHRLLEMTRQLRVGPPAMEPEPFMGPVITNAAAEKLLAAQHELIHRGAVALKPLQPSGGRLAMLSPGVLDVTTVADRSDDEFFGPLLQVIRVPDFAAAIAEANCTHYGLAAGLLSDDREVYAQFRAQIRAGIVNWNRPTTGASGSLPFGGIGASGNHRPAGYFSVDFCADPVASLETPALTMPAALAPGIMR